MAKSRMKRRKSVGKNNGGDTDRLNSLPESLLFHIMSFLPTRTSVTTVSLVSRRWSNLWKHLQAFAFYHYFENMEMFERFEYFVNSVLSLRRSLDIRKFELWIEAEHSGNNIQYDCVEKWILAAIGPQLEDLCIRLHGLRKNLPPSFLMNCTNLVSLTLRGDIKVEVKHSSVHFPLLKRLELGERIVDSDVAFLSGCPKLETLDIDFYPEDIFKDPVPPSSSSKWLKSTNHNFTWSYFDADHILYMGIIGNFHSMVEAFLDVFSSRESVFIDPKLNDYYIDDEYLLNVQLRHTTSKVLIIHSNKV
ncbi:hypothetical protein TSUD_370360 [Trifolium subterraneum]|uniref:F-box domain-containing protein n=1 Tax=Trifolium subterraneum TaxID=3900 RepID=A0A2Z6N3D4_TRISU|nr:hypothetical protein TSUD_370360 [Trifolium subterraneum]